MSNHLLSGKWLPHKQKNNNLMKLKENNINIYSKYTKNGKRNK